MSKLWDKLSPRQKSWTMATTVAFISLAAGYGLSTLGHQNSVAGEQNGASTGKCRKVLYWYDPMVPAQHFDKPGKSPFMDMQLIPKCEGEAKGSQVRIDPSLVQNFGMRTAKAAFGELDPSITVTGQLAYNGRDVAIVQPRVGGFVQRTYDRAPDDVVRRGAPLADILVPEWGGAQQEYLAVLSTRDEQLAQATRQRMRLLGMTDSMIAAVGRSGRAHSTITVTAPIGGVITSLGVRSGMTVTAGQTLAQITGFTPIWLEAAVPETQIANIKVGQAVRATLAAFPEERFAGRIIAILPSAQDASRTVTVRAELSNPNGRLKPGMFAEVSLSPDRHRALLVPTEAVIRTGRRTIVMIKQDNGGFQPAEVRIGREAHGQSEILAGLAPGEEVVISGQFLIDSEASLADLNVRPIDQASSVEEQATSKAATHAAPPIFKAAGRIEKMTARSVTLKHGPVPGLKWPAMTMTFATTGPAQLLGLKVGDTVRFSFSQADAGPRIVSIERNGQ